ncbi:hypothetical protein ACFL21_03335 [Patescibacteria group bacterium]
MKTLPCRGADERTQLVESIRENSSIDLSVRGSIEQQVREEIIRVRGEIQRNWDLFPEFHQVIDELVQREENDRYLLATEMLVQQNLFHQISLQYGLEIVEEYDFSSEDGLMVLTAHHSILIIHPREEKNNPSTEIDLRKMEYIRVPSRVKHWESEVFTYISEFSDVICRKGERCLILGALESSTVKVIYRIPKSVLPKMEELTNFTQTTLSSTTKA